MTRSIVLKTIVPLMAGALLAPAAGAADFYAGKTVKVVHGFGTGGGFDTAARVITRHLTRFVPGKPEFVVQSMPGAGSLIATNFVYNKADPDGLTMGFLFANLLVDEAMSAPGVRFDSGKFAWLAAPSSGTPICSMMAASGIASAADWKAAKTPVKIGAIAKGAEVAFSMPKLLQTQAGFPTHIIVGHKGGNPALKLAAERGEIAGFCASLEATTILFGDALKDGKVKVVVQFGDTADPAIPNVPLAKDLVTTRDGADLIRVAVSGPQQLNRVFAFPPKTDPAKVEVMRKALAEAFKDPQLIADAKKAKVNIRPVDGAGVERVVKQMKAVPKETLAKLKTILEVN